MARKTNANTAKVWKTAAYIRLSREDGDKTESESVINQKQIISDFIATQADLGDFLTFVDDGATGTNFNRQGFQEMLSEIKNGNINCVVVKDLSRFGRNYTEAGTYMEQIFPMFGVRFISVLDHIDSFTRPSEMDSILVPLKNLLNDSYSRDLSVKVKSAMTAKRKRGEFIGAFAAYGYIKDSDDKNSLLVDEEAAPVVRNIFEWYVSGLGKNTIAMKLNEMGIPSPAKHRIMRYPPKKKHNREYANSIMGFWSVQSVNSILENPLYCGHMAQGKRAFISYKNSKQVKIDKDNWIIAENTHTPIIGESLFAKTQELLKLRAKPASETGQVYLFSGLLQCADCHRTMDRTTNKKPNGKVYVSYRCSTYFRRSKEACTKHTIPERELEGAVLAVVQKHIETLVDVDGMMKRIDSKKRRGMQADTISRRLSSLSRELDDTERIKLGLYTDFKKNIISQDEYIALKSGYTEQINRLTAQLAALKEEQDNLDKQEILQSEFLERFREYRNIDSLNRELVVSLIDKIYIYEGRNIEIRFKFQDEFNKLIAFAENEEKETAKETELTVIKNRRKVAVYQGL